MYVVGQAQRNLARLSTHGGRGELRFQFAHLYNGRAFDVLTSFYKYRILDYEEREIDVYDWAPDGISPVRTPHLHFPIAGSVILAQRHGSSLAQRRTSLGKVHFPTSYISIEDIVELLIREFNVDSQREDWASVLEARRQVVTRERS